MSTKANIETLNKAKEAINKAIALLANNDIYNDEAKIDAALTIALNYVKEASEDIYNDYEESRQF